LSHTISKPCRRPNPCITNCWPRYVGPGHEGNEGSRTADGTEGLQVRKDRCKISSFGQPTRDGPPAWGLGEGITILHRESQHVRKCQMYGQKKIQRVLVG